MNDITIYTWPFCPYCIKAKKMLDKKNKEYTEINIYGDSNKLSELKETTGLSTVPQIFVGDQCIGGCDDLEKLINTNAFDKLFE